ncbi:MAG: hypothetical protein DRH24_20380, partial [Deltaproteobacteria bacterium]
GTLYAGAHILWSDTQDGQFVICLTNIWGANASAFDSFMLHLVLTSPYHDPLWTLDIQLDLVPEVAILVLDDEYDIQLGGATNITVSVWDIDGSPIPDNLTTVTGEVCPLSASAYVLLDGQWQYFATATLHNGLVQLIWGHDNLTATLPAGVYSIEIRIGGGATGLILSTAQTSVVVGREPTHLSAPTQCQTVVYGITANDTIRSVLTTEDGPVEGRVVELWVILGDDETLLDTAMTDGQGVALFTVNSSVQTLPAGHYVMYTRYTGTPPHTPRTSKRSWLVVAQDAPQIQVATETSVEYITPLEVACNVTTSTGAPLAGAVVEVQVVNGSDWQTVATGVTDAQGSLCLVIDPTTLGLGNITLRIVVMESNNFMSASRDITINVQPSTLVGSELTLLVNGQPVPELYENYAVLVGDTLTLMARVTTSQGTPLADTTIVVSLGSTEVTARTDERGVFQATIVVPECQPTSQDLMARPLEQGLSGTVVSIPLVVVTGVHIEVLAPSVACAGVQTTIHIITQLQNQSVSATVSFEGQEYHSINGGHVYIPLTPQQGIHQYVVFVTVAGANITRLFSIQGVEVALSTELPTTVYPNETIVHHISASFDATNTTVSRIDVVVQLSVDGIMVYNDTGRLLRDGGYIAWPRWYAPLDNGTHTITTRLLFEGTTIYTLEEQIRVYSLYATISGPTSLLKGMTQEWIVQVWRDNETIGSVFHETVLVDGEIRLDDQTRNQYTVTHMFTREGIHNITVIIVAYDVEYETVLQIAVTSSATPPMSTIGVMGGASVLALVGAAAALRRRGSAVSAAGTTSSDATGTTPEGSDAAPATADGDSASDSEDFYGMALKRMASLEDEKR